MKASVAFKTGRFDALGRGWIVWASCGGVAVVCSVESVYLPAGDKHDDMCLRGSDVRFLDAQNMQRWLNADWWSVPNQPESFGTAQPIVFPHNFRIS